MTEPDIPIRFLDIEGLARRWNCGISTIEGLAETDDLRFSLRPAALEIALAKIPPETYRDMVQKLANLCLDHKYVYLMFKNKDRQIEIARIGDYDVKKILKDPLCVDFFDLIIHIDQVEEFEFVHSNMAHDDSEFKLLSDDFTCFIWRGKEYKFGELQAKVIKRLWQAREDGKPWVYGKYILRDIGSTSYRIKDIFNHNKYWRRIVCADKTGKYKLNLPPKQMTLF